MESKDIDKLIGYNVALFRQRKKLSQLQFSDLMKLSRASIVNMEKGRTSFTAKNIFNACVILGCKPTALFPNIPHAELSFGKRKMTKIQTSYYHEPILKIKE